MYYVRIQSEPLRLADFPRLLQRAKTLDRPVQTYKNVRGYVWYIILVNVRVESERVRVYNTTTCVTIIIQQRVEDVILFCAFIVNLSAIKTHFLSATRGPENKSRLQISYSRVMRAYTGAKVKRFVPFRPVVCQISERKIADHDCGGERRLSFTCSARGCPSGTTAGGGGVKWWHSAMTRYSCPGSRARAKRMLQREKYGWTIRWMKETDTEVEREREC